MVQIDVPIASAAGSFFVDAAFKQLRFGRPEYYYRAIWKNTIFQIFFYSWIPVYFLLNYFPTFWGPICDWRQAAWRQGAGCGAS
jgi:hypothetical protein